MFRPNIDCQHAFSAVTLQIPHDEAQAELRFTSTLNQAATDEAWGLKSLAVYSATPPELVVYETNFDTVGDWVFSGATAGVRCAAGFGMLRLLATISTLQYHVLIAVCK